MIAEPGTALLSYHYTTIDRAKVAGPLHTTARPSLHPESVPVRLIDPPLNLRARSILHLSANEPIDKSPGLSCTAKPWESPPPPPARSQSRTQLTTHRTGPSPRWLYRTPPEPAQGYSAAEPGSDYR